MGISLSQLYSGTTVDPQELPSQLEFELPSSFAVPAINSTGLVTVASAEFFGVGQYVFLSDGLNYGNFQITQVAAETLTLLHYGGSTAGSAIAAGGKIVPSGRDFNVTEFVALQGQVEDLETNKLDAPGGTTAQYIRGDGSLANQSDFSVIFANVSGLARDNADLASELEAIETNKFGTDNLLELQFWL